jgi:hypothetical protein
VLGVTNEQATAGTAGVLACSVPTNATTSNQQAGMPAVPAPGVSLQVMLAGMKQLLLRLTQSTDARDEFNQAFVHMQYVGYLRRNPNEFPDSSFAGSDFWLEKLNRSNGNFIEAEMVKAFLESHEYRSRFGSPPISDRRSQIFDFRS